MDAETVTAIGSVIMWAPSVPVLIIAGVVWAANTIEKWTGNGKVSYKAI